MKPGRTRFLLIYLVICFSLFSIELKPGKDYSSYDRNFVTGFNRLSLVETQIDYITGKLSVLSDPELIRDVMEKLASLYYLTGNPEESQKIYYSLAEIKDNSVSFWQPFFRYLHVLLDRGFIDTARTELEKALKFRKSFDSENVFPLLSVRVRIHQMAGEFAAAIDLLDKYRKLDIHEESPELYYLYYLVCKSGNLKSTWSEIKESAAHKELLQLAEAYESGELKPYPHTGNISFYKSSDVKNVYQVGAYSSKKTAQVLLNRWHDKGYEGWIEKEADLWKVRLRMSGYEYEKEKEKGEKLFPVSS